MRINSIQFLASNGTAAQHFGNNEAFFRDAIAHVVHVLDTCPPRTAIPIAVNGRRRRC